MAKSEKRKVEYEKNMRAYNKKQVGSSLVMCSCLYEESVKNCSQQPKESGICFYWSVLNWSH